MRFIGVRSIKRLLLGLMALFVLIVIGSSVGVVVFNRYLADNLKSQSESKPAEEAGVVGGITGAKIESFSVDQLLNETNAVRGSNSLSGLALNDMLNKSAKAKCDDMVAKNYWSHNSLDGTQPWKFISDAGYKYSKLGENLAFGFSDSKATIVGWMNSPGHRENLLKKEFQDVGFGICESTNYTATGGRGILIIQHLGKPNVAKSAPTSNIKSYKPSVCTKSPIPYKTVNIEASYLYEGETSVGWPGTDGYVEKCTADSSGYTPPDFTIQPIDKTMYVGTKPRP